MSTLALPLPFPLTAPEALRRGLSFYAPLSGDIGARSLRLRGADAPVSEAVDAKGTYTDAGGIVRPAIANVLRIERAGSRLEGARINRNIRSQEFDNAAWTKVAASVTADQAAAPDGTTTADEIIEDSANSTHRVYDQIASLPGVNTDCAVSCFMKANTRNFGVFGLNGTGFNDIPIVSFNLTTGVATNIGGEPYRDAYMISYPNGWWRCVMIVNSDSAGTGFICNVGVHDGSGSWSYQGDGSSSIYVWGIQSEYVTKFPSSYIPTTSAAVTRAQDDLRHASAGHLIGGGSGTFILVATPDFNEADIDADANIFVPITTSPDTRGIQFLYDDAPTPRVTCDFWDGGSLQASLIATTNLIRGVTNVWAATWETNKFRLYADGALEASDNGGSVPASWPSDMFLGQNWLGTAPWFGTLAHLMLFDRALSASEVRALSDTIKNWR